MTKTAVQFGAGNIGRGLIGLNFYQSGYETIFVDVIDKLVDLLDEQGQYPIKEISDAGEQEIIVENVRAINGKNEPAVVEALTQTHLATTAVGPNVLRIVASTIAKGLARRAELGLEEPLNIIACENLINNSQILREHVFSHLSAEAQTYADRWVGFPNCVVDKVVTIPGEAELKESPLLVAAEEGGSLIVDRDGFVGDPPQIKGMQLTDNLPAYVEQKIFTLNTAHAATAYLGYLKGYEFVHEALQDEEIRPVVLGVLEETGAVLVKRHNLDPAKHRQYAHNILARFEGSAMADPVVRVGREPRRKLAPGDRLVMPARLALDVGLTPTHLASAIAAALLFDPADDAQAQEISTMLENEGVEAALHDVAELAPDSELTALVKAQLPLVRQMKM